MKKTLSTLFACALSCAYASTQCMETGITPASPLGRNKDRDLLDLVVRKSPTPTRQHQDREFMGQVPLPSPSGREETAPPAPVFDNTADIWEDPIVPCCHECHPAPAEHDSWGLSDPSSEDLW